MRCLPGRFTSVLLALLFVSANAQSQVLSAPTLSRIDSGRGDVARATAVDAGGNFYVAGSIDDRSRPTQFAVAKYNAQGQLVWRTHESGTLGGPVAVPRGVAVDSQGNVYATGAVMTTVGISSTWQQIVVSFDAAGRQRWSRAAGGARVRVDAADRIVAVSPGGVLSQFDSAGNLLWTRLAPSPASVAEMQLDASGAAAVAATGPARTVLGAGSIVAFKVDPQGQLIWRSEFTRSAISDDRPAALAHAPDGGVYVVGTTAEDASGEIPSFPVLLKFDGLGVSSVVGIGTVYGGRALAVGAGGDVTLAGGGIVSRLDAAGALRWSTAVAGADLLALEADGGSVVAGVSSATRLDASGRSGPAARYSDAGIPGATLAGLELTSAGVAVAAGTFATSALSTAADIVVLRFAGGTTVPAPGTPEAPTNLTASARAGAITLRWRDNSANEQGFRIERCAQANCGDFAAVAEVGANTVSFIDTSVPRGLTVRYRVRARNAAGESAPSNAEQVRAR